MTWCSDEDVLKYFFTDKQGVWHDKIVKNKIKNMPDEIKEWLGRRFGDSESYNEAIYRVKLHIETRPKCSICGNPVKYKGAGRFAKVCSPSCSGKQSLKSVIEKYGVRSTLSLSDVKQKSSKTIYKKYEVNNVSKSPLIKAKKQKTFLEHFGYANNFSNKKTLEKAISRSMLASEKRKSTFKSKYDVSMVGQLNKGKKLSDAHKKKISQVVSSPQFQQKRNNTLAEHHTWNTSKYEDLVYQELIRWFQKDDVKCQYRCERYPFNCDFYIKTIDVFIEVQCSQFHHFHPFNFDSIIDKQELRKLRMKATDKHPQYKNIIETWTVSDVKKRKIAKKNNLHYIEIWPDTDIKHIIEELKKLCKTKL